MNYFTSLELSKKLKENGWELESDRSWAKIFMAQNISEYQLFHNFSLKKTKGIIYPAYDIVYDICIRYAKEFFGEEKSCGICKEGKEKDLKNLQSEEIYFPLCECGRCGGVSEAMIDYRQHTLKILSMLQQDKPQEEIEAYIWDNCVFRSKSTLIPTIRINGFKQPNTHVLPTA